MLRSTSAGMGSALEDIIVIPMSLDDYFRWPEEGKVEWVDGEAFVMPPAKMRHENIIAKLVMMFGQTLPEEKVVITAGSGFARFSKYRIPDVMVVDRKLTNLDDSWADSALILVEVLSLSTFMVDTHVKSNEYALAGVGQYWIVDPRDRTVLIQENDNRGGWRTLAELSEANPIARVELPGIAAMELNWNDIFQHIPPAPDWG